MSTGSDSNKVYGVIATASYTIFSPLRKTYTDTGSFVIPQKGEVEFFRIQE